MKPQLCISLLLLISAHASGAEEGDLRPIRGAIAPPFWETTWPYVIIGIFLIAAIFGVIAKRTVWKKTPPKAPTPYEIAIGQLEEARALMVAKKDKEFSSVVSDAIRQYIEKRFAIKAPEQTTEEFLVAAAQHPMLKGEALDQLSQFLELCDVVKFAQQSFGAMQREAQYSSAEQFLLESERNLEEHRTSDMEQRTVPNSLGERETLNVPTQS